MTQRVSFPFSALWLSLLLVAALTACKPENEDLGSPLRPSGGRGIELSDQDREFLEKAAQGNNAEVAVATLGAARATDPAIVEFAKALVDDHSSAQKELLAIAAKRAVVLPDSLGEQQRSFDEVVDEEGERFEDLFMARMIEDHQNAIPLYQAQISDGTDPLLKEYAATMLPKIQAHLAKAREIEGLSSGVKE